jgi:AcrR family transcriptional regulator
MSRDPSPVSAPACQSLRERKKQQTRHALVSAAAELFLDRGYDETTVEAIVSAADVSPRTFFRYFDSKDDVALARLQERDDHFLEVFGIRPAGETPLRSLTGAFRDVWDDEEPADRQETQALIALINRTPPLLAADLRRQQRNEARLVDAVVRRDLGLSADEACILVSAFTSAVRLVIHGWLRGADAASPPEVLERCLAQLRGLLR